MPRPSFKACLITFYIIMATVTFGLSAAAPTHSPPTQNSTTGDSHLRGSESVQQTENCSSNGTSDPTTTPEVAYRISLPKIKCLINHTSAVKELLRSSLYHGHLTVLKYLEVSTCHNGSCVIITTNF